MNRISLLIFLVFIAGNSFGADIPSNSGLRSFKTGVIPKESNEKEEVKYVSKPIDMSYAKNKNDAKTENTVKTIGNYYPVFKSDYTSNIYHEKDCKLLKGNPSRIFISEAIQNKMTKCDKCNPPTNYDKDNYYIEDKYITKQTPTAKPETTRVFTQNSSRSNSINIQQDAFGRYSGTAGGKVLNCYSDGFGRTICR